MNSDKLTVGSATAITDTMEKFDIVLGVLEEEKQEIPKDVKTLAEKREEARKAKKWDESDKLRDQIQELGYTVADTKDGFILKKL